ncbi:MAG: Capsular glucan synthase [Parcubacteria group bacterium ADurb.Bin326]|nr:MAG: Capsular glucan synthase [Parcubacteria group bacterium ADurb.Bin326]
MRIGIDCRTILNPNGGELAGVGHYTYYLVKNLLLIDKENEYVLFFDNNFSDFEQFEAPNVKIVKLPFYQYKKYLPITYSQMLISAFFAREKLDLLHSPANVIPLFYRWPAVVTIHDLAIYKFPDFFPSGRILKQSFATKVLVPDSVSRAKKVIAVSQNTKDDIVDIFGIPENKIEVVHEGVISHGKNCPNQASFASVREKHNLSERYLLFVGSIEPRKNLIALVKAFKNYKLSEGENASDLELVFAGGKGWKNEGVFEAIKEANQILSAKGDVESIKYLGYVSLADKLSLIAHATAFVFPSFYEGFGLPVLEAMSMSTPVVASNASSVPEITGKDGAILVDPYKESEIQDAISQIISDEGLREQLAIKGHNRAQEFTWRRCAEKTLAVYLEAVSK